MVEKVCWNVRWGIIIPGFPRTTVQRHNGMIRFPKLNTKKPYGFNHGFISRCVGFRNHPQHFYTVLRKGSSRKLKIRAMTCHWNGSQVQCRSLLLATSKVPLYVSQLGYRTGSTWQRKPAAFVTGLGFRTCAILNSQHVDQVVVP